MRAINELLPAYESSRGLSARTIGQRLHGREVTIAEVAMVDRAAQRLVQRGLAGRTFAAEDHTQRVYFRAEGAVIPGDAPDSSHDDDGSVVIVRSGPVWMATALDALLPAYESSRGLSARTLASRIYDREATTTEIAAVDRAAQRLVRQDLADSAFTGPLKVYFRAHGAPAPSHAGVHPHDDDESVVIVRPERQADPG